MGESRPPLSPPSSVKGQSSHGLYHKSPHGSPEYQSFLLDSPKEPSLGLSPASLSPALSQGSFLETSSLGSSHGSSLSSSSKYPTFPKSHSNSNSNSISSLSTSITSSSLSKNTTGDMTSELVSKPPLSKSRSSSFSLFQPPDTPEPSSPPTQTITTKKPPSSPSPSVNRAAAFPSEVNAFIFEELREMDASGTLANCALICKTWLPFVRAVLYRRPNEPLPLRLYGSEEREWWIDEWNDGQLCGLVEALESKEFGPLVKMLDIDANLDYGGFRTRMEDVIPELNAILPRLTNCDSLNMKGLRYPKLDRLFLAITKAAKPVKHLSMAFSLRSYSVYSERTLINIPRYLNRRDHLAALKDLTSLKIRQYKVASPCLWMEEEGERRGNKKEFEKTCPSPSWSLVSLELIRCYIKDPEFPVLFGQPGGKLQHIRLQRCPGGFSADLLLSIIRSHTPKGGLTSLALIKMDFIDSSKSYSSTIVEEMVRLSPNLIRLELEGHLHVNDQFLTSIIPRGISILRIIPFDQSLPGYILGRLTEGKGDIFPCGFAPLDWQRYFQSPRSTFLQSLTIGRSRHWTNEEVNSLGSGARVGQDLRVEIAGPINCDVRFGELVEDTTEDTDDWDMEPPEDDNEWGEGDGCY